MHLQHNFTLLSYLKHNNTVNEAIFKKKAIKFLFSYYWRYNLFSKIYEVKSNYKNSQTFVYYIFLFNKSFHYLYFVLHI